MEVARGWMPHQANIDTHTHIECSRRFYQGTEMMLWALNGQVWAPKRLWDDCLVREAYVRSSTVLDILSLEGKFPDKIVKGQTSDISPLAENAWYEWVKFRDTGQSFPDSKE
jgi:hypothetical protein